MPISSLLDLPCFFILFICQPRSLSLFHEFSLQYNWLGCWLFSCHIPALPPEITSQRSPWWVGGLFPSSSFICGIFCLFLDTLGWTTWHCSFGRFMWFNKKQTRPTRGELPFASLGGRCVCVCLCPGGGGGGQEVMHGSLLPLSGNRLFWAAPGVWDLVPLAIHSSSN